jgi:hypothetical protein
MADFERVIISTTSLCWMMLKRAWPWKPNVERDSRGRKELSLLVTLLLG